MGSWITFDVPPVAATRDRRADVLERFFQLGGGMVDSSPMYGYAEEVLGYSLNRVNASGLFAASKIWTPLGAMAAQQLSDTESLWGIKSMDLMYVHNLLNWKSHLPKLRRWKDEGRVRYIGVTTSHGRRHDELANVLRSEPLDFVQLTYNVDDTVAQERLLPLAQERGIAVVVNRPFQRGALFQRYANKPLPSIARELGCENWAQAFLLFVVSHPAVTCAIPATSRVDHMQENMGTLRLALPDSSARRALHDQLIKV